MKVKLNVQFGGCGNNMPISPAIGPSSFNYEGEMAVSEMKELCETVGNILHAIGVMGVVKNDKTDDNIQ